MAIPPSFPTLLPSYTPSPVAEDVSEDQQIMEVAVALEEKNPREIVWDKLNQFFKALTTDKQYAIGLTENEIFLSLNVEAKQAYAIRIEKFKSNIRALESDNRDLQKEIDKIAERMKKNGKDDSEFRSGPITDDDHFPHHVGSANMKENQIARSASKGITLRDDYVISVPLARKEQNLYIIEKLKSIVQFLESPEQIPKTENGEFLLTKFHSALTFLIQNKIAIREEAEGTAEKKATKTEQLAAFLDKMQSFMNDISTFPEYKNNVPEAKMEEFLILSKEGKEILKNFGDFANFKSNLERKIVRVSEHLAALEAEYNKAQTETEGNALQELKEELDRQGVPEEQKTMMLAFFGNPSAFAFDPTDQLGGPRRELAHLKEALDMVQTIIQFLDATEEIPKLDNGQILFYCASTALSEGGKNPMFKMFIDYSLTT